MRPLAWLQVYVFAGAALLFAMEPMVGRLLLPSFGSAFHVWSTALMFFQGALFVGYLYAHVVAPRIGRVHLALLLAPLPFLPFVSPATREAPTVGALLSTMVMRFGIPFVVLASTSVIAQQWLTRSKVEGRDEPYRLYASSNAGSLLALVVYVAIWEPFSGLRQQTWIWAVGYLLYVGAAYYAFVRVAPETKVEGAGPRPPTRDLIYWVLLAAAPSAFSISVTNLFVLDVGNAPFVWILPLVVYLMTFILVFGRAEFHPRWLKRLWPHVAVLGFVAYFLIGGVKGGAPIVHLSVLFIVGTAAHGELYDKRPEPASLTWFYLALSLGGWVGSALVAVVAPFAFDGLWEYPLSLVAVLAIMAVGKRAWTAPKKSMGAFGVVVAVAVAAVLIRRQQSDHALDAGRSPYGVYRVNEGVEDGERVRRLYSGRTLHGRQRIFEGRGNDAALAHQPLGYYHASAPLGDVLASLPRPRRIGVVGLGVGAIAGHLEEGEHATFFEIDPLVVDFAQRHFTYLDSRGDVRLVTGDARHTLADEDEEGADRYDVLVVDAFSGDSVPLHLLTLEAMRLYKNRVDAGGLILFHVSNRYLTLEPSIRAAAEPLGLVAYMKKRTEDLAPLEDPSKYVVVGPEERVRALASFGWERVEGEPVLLTDDRASLLPLWHPFD